MVEPLRKNGYYWVCRGNIGWESAAWTGSHWLCIDSVTPRVDTDFTRIDNTRLLPPD